jgi:hypothetical protein
MDIKKILREALENSEGITKLSVFDFDGTLVNTPLPEVGKPIWKEKTGEEWPHKGWWGRIESLDMNVFDFPTLPDIVSAYKTEAADKNTMVVLLTGRRTNLAASVKAILDSHGLSFDAYLYNYGGDTGDNKIEQIENILNKVPAIKEVEFWDDRLSHFEKFNNFGNGLVKDGRLETWNLVEVPNPQWTK